MTTANVARRAAELGQLGRMSDCIREVTLERRRQIEALHYDTTHDDRHPGGELVRAAICYASVSAMVAAFRNGEARAADDTSKIAVPINWPFEPTYWRPRTMRRNLIKAAALIIAEIERIDRMGKAAR